MSEPFTEEQVEAGARALYEQANPSARGDGRWFTLMRGAQDHYRRQAHAVLSAALDPSRQDSSTEGTPE